MNEIGFNPTDAMPNNGQLGKRKVNAFYIISSVIFLLLFVCFYTSPLTMHIGTYFEARRISKNQLGGKLFYLGLDNEVMDLTNQDDTSVADEMAARVRVLCWILTHDHTIRTKAMAVMRTWGPRCTSIYFITDAPYDGLPVIVLNNTGKDHLVFKSRDALDYLYRHHLRDADWFLKADDDTYVIMENLRYLLDNQDPDEPIAFGQQINHPKKTWKYLTGGPGYVMSRMALEKFANRKPDMCAVDSSDGTMEDIRVSWCLQDCGVTLVNSTDRLGRQRFHHHPLTSCVTGFLEKWFYELSADPVKVGAGNLSLYPVSFHHMEPTAMVFMDAVLYSIRRHGVVYGYHNINQ